MEIKIGSHTLGPNQPTYFIADIAANHDGDLERAKLLIRLAKEAGADAAKFQNFRAPRLFPITASAAWAGRSPTRRPGKNPYSKSTRMPGSLSNGTPILKAACDEVGIDYFSSPYDYEALDMLTPYVPAYKAGSGLMSWPEMLVRMASQGKPIILSTGASDIAEVVRAMRMVQAVNREIVLMQCNTNYTASPDNYDHLHLNVLKTYATLFPQAILGLSDHTHSPAPIVGAVTMGARVIERHFTDSNEREGPDHKFAMNPQTWADMVAQVRILERAFGSHDKFVAGNEKDTVVVQRRCLRAALEIKAGEVFSREMIDVLRPATPGAIPPHEIEAVIGARALVNMPSGKELRWLELGS